ncbi:hypothetical protein B0H11DRAFT_1922740 [Mycena galericulata]|nr:hypothetical protein B0H11DRAFT_1922740 [Mycena galericulata]
MSHLLAKMPVSDSEDEDEAPARLTPVEKRKATRAINLAREKLENQALTEAAARNKCPRTRAGQADLFTSTGTRKSKVVALANKVWDPNSSNRKRSASSVQEPEQPKKPKPAASRRMGSSFVFFVDSEELLAPKYEGPYWTKISGSMFEISSVLRDLSRSREIYTVLEISRNLQCFNFCKLARGMLRSREIVIRMVAVDVVRAAHQVPQDTVRFLTVSDSVPCRVYLIQSQGAVDYDTDVLAEPRK